MMALYEHVFRLFSLVFSSLFLFFSICLGFSSLSFCFAAVNLSALTTSSILVFISCVSVCSVPSTPLSVSAENEITLTDNKFKHFVMSRKTKRFVVTVVELPQNISW